MASSGIAGNIPESLGVEPGVVSAAERSRRWAKILDAPAK